MVFYDDPVCDLLGMGIYKIVGGQKWENMMSQYRVIGMRS